LPQISDRSSCAYDVRIHAYKIIAAAWTVFVIVYLPLVLFTQRFTLLPDTPLEIGLIVVLAVLGGIGKHDPETAAIERMRARQRGD
jgi:hypothetical protein